MLIRDDISFMERWVRNTTLVQALVSFSHSAFAAHGKSREELIGDIESLGHVASTWVEIEKAR